MTSDVINRQNLIHKLFSLFEECRKHIFVSVPVKKIIQETKFVDLVQSLVEYGNSSILESFKIVIEMEQDEAVSLQGKEESKV